MPGPSEDLPASLNLREVIPGRLWRGAAPVQWDPARWHNFALAERLRLIVDLRMPLERERQGTPPMPPGCAVVALPLFESPLPGWEHPEDRSPRATAGRYFEMAEVGRPALVEIAERFQRDEGTFFVHCAAGRDRTGIAVACLLSLVGAEERRIVDDYALSHGLAFDGGHAYPETMVHFLTLLRQHYGSVEEFLRR